jgi:L-threonylcarbamoyladenylate synthase
VLDLSEEQPVLLRPGGVPREKLQALLGSIADPESGGERRSPGMLQSHYAPQRPLRLNAREARPGEALLAFGPDPPKGFAEVRSLSETGDLVEAAARLFASLRALDRPEITAIAVMPIPESGLGAAINDRLRRAAAPR